MKKLSNILQFDALKQWYHTPLGKQILTRELSALSKILSELFGYIIAQLGGPDNHQVLAASKINNKIIINKNLTLAIDKPILSQEKIDVMIAMHALECTTMPHILLEQIYQALIPNGYLIILGLNPYSKLGISSLLSRNQPIPWRKKWITPGKMHQLLKQHGFVMTNHSQSLIKAYCASNYILVAQKLTPATIVATNPIAALPEVDTYATLAREVVDD